MVRLAREYGFLLFSDECYSEIWRGRAPDGVLSAAFGLGGGFNGVVAFNSLSKRSNLAGARCGFAIGDPVFLKSWAALRNVSAPQVPMPIQAVAVAALADEAHVAENRRLYDLKYAAAAEILGDRFPDLVPPGGFFLWLDVGRWGGGERSRPGCGERLASRWSLAVTCRRPTRTAPTPAVISFASRWSKALIRVARR
jgi:Aspartate/tyrosine/aromatic aminotransferase